MRVLVDPASGAVTEAELAFGGVAPKTIMAPRVAGGWRWRWRAARACLVAGAQGMQRAERPAAPGQWHACSPLQPAPPSPKTHTPTPPTKDTRGRAPAGLSGAAPAPAPPPAAHLVGKPWGQESLEGALALLPADIDLSDSAPGGRVEYRRSLAASFLFKLYASVALGLEAAGLAQVRGGPGPGAATCCRLPLPGLRGLMRLAAAAWEQGPGCPPLGWGAQAGVRVHGWAPASHRASFNPPPRRRPCPQS
jgi:hypothetical protein